MAYNVKGATRSFFDQNQTTSTPKPFDPAAEAQNIETRIKAAGLSTAPADDRNFVERGLNLQKNQGFIMDVFEVINRPQQAIFGAWKAAQEGKDAGKAFMEGLSGEEETRFKEILTSYGMTDRKGKLDAADVLGFIGDVLLDPVDLAFIPVTGGANVLLNLKDAERIIRNVDNVSDVIQASKGLVNSADDILAITKKGLDAKKALKAGDRSAETLKAIEDLIHLQDSVGTALKGQKVLRRVSPTSLAANKIVEGMKFVKGGKKFKNVANYVDEVQKGIKLDDFHEWVDVETLMKYQDAERAGKVASGEIDTLADTLKYNDKTGFKSFIQNGFYVPDNPVRIFYDTKSGKVIVGEGNHRLEIAAALGIKKIPVTVMTGGTGNLAPVAGTIKKGLLAETQHISELGNLRNFAGGRVLKGNMQKPTEDFIKALEEGIDSIPISTTRGGIDRLRIGQYPNGGERILFRDLAELNQAKIRAIDPILSKMPQSKQLDELVTKLHGAGDWTEAEKVLGEIRDYAKGVPNQSAMVRYLDDEIKNFADSAKYVPDEIAAQAGRELPGGGGFAETQTAERMRNAAKQDQKAIQRAGKESVKNLQENEFRRQAVKKLEELGILKADNAEKVADAVNRGVNIIIDTEGKVRNATEGFMLPINITDDIKSLDAVQEALANVGIAGKAIPESLDKSVVSAIVKNADGKLQLIAGHYYSLDEVLDIPYFRHNAINVADGSVMKQSAAMFAKENYEKALIDFVEKGTKTRYISGTDVVFRGTKSLLVNTLHLTDSLVQKGLGFMADNGKALRTYNDFKLGLRKTVDQLASVSKATLEKAFQASGKQTFSKGMMATKGKKVLKELEDIAKETGLTTDEVYAGMLSYIEKEFNPQDTIRNIIARADDAPLTADVLKKLDNLFDVKNPLLNDFLKQYGDNAGFKSAMFEEVILSNGEAAYKVRNKELLDEVMVRLEHSQRVGEAVDLLRRSYDNGLRLTYEKSNKFISDIKKFLDENHKIVATMSDEYKINGHAINFDDLFRETKTGYILQNKAKLLNLLDINTYNPVSKLDDLMDVPRYKTTNLAGNKAMDELVAKLPKERLKDVANDYYDILRINDKIMGTKIFNPNFKGYARHALTKEARELGHSLSEDTISNIPDSDLFTGNLQAFKSRKYQLPTEEANILAKYQAEQMLKLDNLSEEARAFWGKRANIDLFSTSIQDSIEDMITYAPDQAAAVSKMQSVLVEATFRNEDVFRKVKIGEKGTTAPAGFYRIDGKQLRNKLEGMEQIVEDPSSMQRFRMAFLKNIGPNDAFYVDKNVFNMIGVLNKFNQDSTLKIFLKGLDKANNLFKGTKLLSPGFQMRNVVGNFTNMMLAGMPADAILTHTVRANRILKQGPEIFDKVAKDGLFALTASERKVYDYYKLFVENNFEGAFSGVMDIENIMSKLEGENVGKNIPGVRQVEKLMLLNNSANVYVDARYRMAMLVYASEHPKLLTKLNAATPVEAVRKVLFDPNDLTAVEKDVYKRMIPFYTFAKKNLQYQMSNIFQNPVYYHRLQKTIDGTWRNFAGMDPNDVEAYKRENFWIPLPGKADGNYVALKVNLPVGDLNEFTTNPMAKLLGSLAPAIRTPFELQTNKQVFTGMPIESYKGQQGRIFDNLSRKQEYVLGQTGLDVPAATVKDIITAIATITKGEAEGFGSIFQTAVGRSMTSAGSVQQAQTTKGYEDLNALQDLLKYYKAEGYNIPTLSELENRNQNQISLGTRFSNLLK